MKKDQLFMAAFLFAILVISRIMPHPHNFTALTSVGLLSGTLFRGQVLRFLIPLFAVLATDIYFGIYPGIEWTYLGIAGGVLLAPRKEAALPEIGVRAFVSAVAFFIFSNLGVWWSSGLYTPDSAGLLQCFVFALPFLNNTVWSAVLYSVVFFSLYRVVFYSKGFQGFFKVNY